MQGIALPSVQSLLIVPRARGNDLGVGTAFVVDGKSGPLLITNWHVLAGRNLETKQPTHPSGALPDEITIVHNTAGALGSWHPVTEPLQEGGENRWFEHPKHAENVDVVALPLTKTAGVQLYPHDLTGGSKIFVGPAEPVSVVGFPFGFQAGGSFAVWATGFLASEPDDIVHFRFAV